MKCGYCNGKGYIYDETLDKDIICKECCGTGEEN